MEEKKIELVYGRGSRKSIPQHYYDWFLKTGFKLLQYEIYLETMEEHRNSFSKTDHDVHGSKKDFYLRNGITTPAYNCQIAVSSGYIVEILTCQFRADSPAWIPFMEQFYLGFLSIQTRSRRRIWK
ncbi:MAG: hypothetical protein K2H85_06635 [Allobaculum sp.]|nr:hypothetical protein [Allobaculum sp.]